MNPHDAKQSGMETLRQLLGTSPLEFCYTVPEEQFETSSTNPVDAFEGFDFTHVWHILVPNPNRKGKQKH
jgi:hypothetical protein